MVKILIKFLLAFALCFWLFKNGKLDFSLIPQAIHGSYLWILGLLFLLSRLFISANRFKILLDTKSSTKISLFKVICFDAIGSFFSVILPGSAAGDVIRFFYYRNLNNKLTSPTIASILVLDRLIGLMGLMALGFSICVIQYKSIEALNPKLLSFIFINGSLFLAIALFVVVIFSNLFSREKIIEKLSKYFSKWPKFVTGISDLLTIKLSFFPFLKCFLLSLLNQSMIIAAFWALASPFIPENVSFLNILTILPIGMIGAALPISPAGLGVGHVLFDNLFKLLTIENGASLFNLFFVCHVLVSLLGVFPYLLIKKDLNKK